MNRISHFIVHSWAATAIAALLCMVTWSHTIMQGDTGGTLSYVNLLLYLAFGVLIGRDSNSSSAGSHKVALPATLFFMSCAINPQLAPWQEGTVYFMLMAGAYHILLGTYRNHTAMGSYFTAFCLIAVASLRSPQLLYVLPFLVLCCGFMQSLHIRTMLAALFGILMPYWVAFCILFLTDNTHRIHSFAGELTADVAQALPPIHIPLGEGTAITIPMIAIQLAWTLLLILPAVAHHILSATSKVRTRANRYMQIGDITILLAATLLSPSLYTVLQPTVVALTAVLSYDLFTVKGKGRNIWLITMFAIWLLFYVMYIWNSFSTY